MTTAKFLRQSLFAGVCAPGNNTGTIYVYTSGGRDYSAITLMDAVSAKRSTDTINTVAGNHSTIEGPFLLLYRA